MSSVKNICGMDAHSADIMILCGYAFDCTVDINKLTVCIKIYKVASCIPGFTGLYITLCSNICTLVGVVRRCTLDCTLSTDYKSILILSERSVLCKKDTVLNNCILLGNFSCNNKVDCVCRGVICDIGNSDYGVASNIFVVININSLKCSVACNEEYLPDSSIQ